MENQQSEGAQLRTDNESARTLDYLKCEHHTHHKILLNYPKRQLLKISFKKYFYTVQFLSNFGQIHMIFILWNLKVIGPEKYQRIKLIIFTIRFFFFSTDFLKLNLFTLMKIE